MAVNLSFIGGAGWQFFDNNGNPLSGGKIYTYAAGTTTPLATFTSRNGLTANTNPIILDSAGRTPQQIWSTEGLLYKYEVMTSADVLIRSWDNIGGSVVASDLAQDLANNVDPTKGDALIGFRQSNSAGNLANAVGRTVHQKLQEFVSILDFGASPTASAATNAAAIQNAFSSGAAYVTVPDAIFDCGNAVISVDHDDFTLVGLGTVSVNKSNNTFTSGPVIKATIASNSFDGISLKNIGIDTKLAALTEGIVIVNCSDVVLENVTVIGSDTNNHTCLIENVQNSTTNGFTSYGGIQGFAIKAVDFFVNDVTSYDTITYGFTARFSPGAPCNNGFINNVNLQTNLLARSGGFVLMNDQSGAAMSDIIVNNVIVENCSSGVYVLNGGNATKATRIKFSNVILRDINGFAFQTFGNVDSISIDGIEFKDCSGTIFTNQATGTTRLTVSNLKQDNSGVAIVSGSGHIFNAWEKAGGGGFFGQNTSTDLQYFDMDVTVTPFVNITDISGTGTIARKVEFPNDVFIPTNGLLYPMRLRADRIRTIADTLAQNNERVLFSLVSTSDNVAEITLSVLSGVGRQSAKYLICGTTVTLLGGSPGSTNVFDVVLSGNEVRFKWVWAVTETVYVDAIYSLFGEDA